MTHNPNLEIDRNIVGDVFTSDEAWENLRILTDEFGSRFGGTPGEKQAAEFLAEKMRSYGLANVALEPVPYLSWTRADASLELLAPVQKTIPCISLPQSPAAEVEAELVDMKEGAPRDFDSRSPEIEGKIVLTSSETGPIGVQRRVHRKEKLGRSILAGAAGFIFFNHYPGFGPPTGSTGHQGRACLIPTIGLSHENGAYLQRLIRQHDRVRVRLATRDHMQPAESWNVVGEIPGETNELIAYGSHYDGHDISQGAQDPASGVAAVLEAARVLAAYGNNFKRTIRVLFWGIEEIGLLGSQAYVQTHAGELDDLRFYFNMDAAGSVREKGVVLNEWLVLAPLFEAWSREMNLPCLVGQSISAHSDHYPFLMAGVPTGGMQTVRQDLSGRGYGHTYYDTLDKVDIGGLRDAASLAARLMYRVANVTDWPAKRRSQAEVQALFAAPQYQEEAQLMARVREYYAKHTS